MKAEPRGLCVSKRFQISFPAFLKGENQMLIAPVPVWEFIGRKSICWTGKWKGERGDPTESTSRSVVGSEMFGNEWWQPPQDLPLPLPAQGIPRAPVLGGFTAVSWFGDKELLFSPCPCCSLPWPRSSWDLYLLLSTLISPYFYSF